MPAALFFLLSCAVTGQPPAQALTQSDLPALLARTTAYVDEYDRTLTSLVSEERYEQRFQRRREPGVADTVVARTLLSDYLLVQVGKSQDWVPLRDVYSADGQVIRDRTDRLLTLLTNPAPNAMAQAMRLRDESRRYNLGSGVRDTNVPTFALQILRPENRPGFAFTFKGRDRVGDVDAAVLEFVETERPTLIVGAQNEDVPCKGRFWIDPESGRVVKWVLETRPRHIENRIEVTFRADERLGIWVPAEMKEKRQDDAGLLEAKATYTNVRRFQVSTTIDIK
jgi:hypothetical protein